MCFSFILKQSFSLKMIQCEIYYELYFLPYGVINFAAHMKARTAIQRNSTENIIYLLNTLTKQMTIQIWAG